MTIAETDREIRTIVEKHHVYGAEAVINALVRAVKNEKQLSKHEIEKMLDHAFEREEQCDQTVRKEASYGAEIL